MPTPHQQKKRGKTFTGCWTCRDRGVKCDLGKPHCATCAKSKKSCQGYGIRLVWLDENDHAPHEQSRRLFTEAGRQPPVHDDASLEHAIESLDGLVAPCNHQVPPFGVFSVSGARNDTNSGAFGSSNSTISLRSCNDGNNKNHGVISLSTTPHTIVGTGAFTSPMLSQANLLGSIPSLTTDPLQFVFPSLPPEDRVLFHHWTSHLSGIILPIPITDNPYRDVMIPLALSNTDTLASLALLHGIYAIAAFNLTEQYPPKPEYRVHAIRNYKVSIRLLHQSLTKPNEDPGTIFATITILASIYLVVGDSANWRIHLKGGRDFLRATRISFQNSWHAGITYQLFRCLEMFALTQDTKRMYTSIVPHGYYTNLSKEDQKNGLQGYYLERFFGLPIAVFKALQRMHDIRHSLIEPTNQELDDIEALIEEAKVPDDRLFTEHGGFSDILMHHHRMTFYLAAHIQLQREFRTAPLPAIQHLVQQCAEHLETIYRLEKTARVCGVGWPLYIAACDAESQELRERFMYLFTKGEHFGIGSLKHATKVVRKVWEQRDATGECSPLHRQEVMNSLGLDILLA
ncbi:uncharacterized protein K452DRAFT_359530 [Aplosporella prunicola CBS 121167]|uniref:Zn(2)-C6 fungal-type domain-containing protein n=1 Tax=Aplosporella prunicola CBS 121167 TaxID=1176127 RepID=A0A6A6B8B0_9PEZI|nr:uncharacterized protein K452DRAFT_359530 [Aplosporella prunicola CBS 121167]KAF2140452.1 hypothetical protein K452DRAFT_359530 [Aplosporella prunicola CBS 121167]